MIEIAKLGAIFKEHSIAQPIKPVGKNDLALCSCRCSMEIHGGHNLVSDSKVDLARMWGSESVGLPKGHISIIAGKRA